MSDEHTPAIRGKEIFATFSKDGSASARLEPVIQNGIIVSYFLVVESSKGEAECNIQLDALERIASKAVRRLAEA